MSVSAWLVSGWAARYELVEADTVLEVLDTPLNVHVSGAALAVGMTIAADATPPSRPPANMPYMPRRTVVADIFIELLLRSAILSVASLRSNPNAHRVKLCRAVPSDNPRRHA